MQRQGVSDDQDVGGFTRMSAANNHPTITATAPPSAHMGNAVASLQGSAQQ
jgi:hypothetical protein